MRTTPSFFVIFILTILFILMLLSCADAPPTDKNIASKAPDVPTNTGERVTYPVWDYPKDTPAKEGRAPEKMEVAKEIPKEAPRCFAEEYIYDIPSQPVSSHIISFVPQAWDIEHIRLVPYDLQYADHVHLKHVYLTTTGPNFDFMIWTDIYLKDAGESIAWGGDFKKGQKKISLSVNGALDLISHLEDGRIHLKASGVATAPSKDMRIGGQLVFVRFFDCYE